MHPNLPSQILPVQPPPCLLSHDSAHLCTAIHPMCRQSLLWQLQLICKQHVLSKNIYVTKEPPLTLDLAESETMCDKLVRVKLKFILAFCQLQTERYSRSNLDARRPNLREFAHWEHQQKMFYLPIHETH